MSMCVRYAGDSYTYLLDSVATDHGRAHAGVEASAMTRYYAAHGTPPGTWLGAGLAGLNSGEGLRTGAVVTPVQMERLFARGEDPTTGTRLGQSPHQYGDGDSRRPVAGFDCTFTAPKSVSVLWALADHQTREVIYAAHRRAITDVVELIERDVAKTRIGTNGIAQVDVAGVVAAAFDHWDSRENDPNLHTHVVIANRAQGPDGKWRTLDSRAIHKAAVAMSERYDTILADHLTVALGLEWEYRDRGPNRNPAHELAAVPQPLLEVFSRRSQAIDEETDRLIDAYVAAHGHRPDPATVIRLPQQATLATRPAKELHSLEELTNEWRTRAVDALGQDPGAWAARVLVPAPPEVADPLPPGPRVVVDEVAEQVLAILAVKRSTWTAWNVDAEASRALKHHRFATPAERDAAVAAVVEEVSRRSVLLTPPETAPVPAAFRRGDGSSAFRHHRAERYTSQGLLDAERRLLTAGRDVNGPALDLGDVSSTPGLFPDQAAAVAAIATSGRVVDVLVGPAGSGKTRTLAALREAWETQHGPGSVVGLAPSAAATEVLAQSLGVGCENTAKWLVEHDAEPDRLAKIDRARAALHRADPGAARSIVAHLLRLEAEVDRWRFRSGQLVILDEASLAGTTALDRIAACAGEAGAKLLLVGDWAQLSAVDAGGAFGLLARDRGPGIPELGTARRFTHPWERTATTRLRVGDAAVLDEYDAHDRIHGADRDAVLDGAYTSWAYDETTGKTSLLIAGDVETVRALNHRARTDRIADGLVEPDGTRLRDGLRAGVGDRVVTRRNDRHLQVGDGWVKNGDTFTVAARGDDGSLTVQRTGGGPAVVLPAGYVAEHVELGYATTAHRAQGATVDTAHAIATGTMTREVLYVAMTRGRESNDVYVCTDGAPEPLTGFADQQQTARGVLEAVIARTGDNDSAHEVRHLEHETATSIRTRLAEYETIAHHALAPRWADLLTRAGLTPEQVADVEDSPAYGALSTALRRAEAHGLPLAAAMPRLVDGAGRDADDLAAVLHARVERFTDAAIAGGRTRPARLVGGLVPPALDVADTAAAEALRSRERLVEERADTMLERARTAGAPWAGALGNPPAVEPARSAWIAAARTVAAYRDRYGITEHGHPLGPAVETDRQRAGDRARAADALVTLGVDGGRRQPRARGLARPAAPGPERECRTSVGR